MKAPEFDEKFDAARMGRATSTGRRRGVPNSRSSASPSIFPRVVVEGLDREPRRLGVTRQAFVKLWIAERLV